MKNVAEYFDKNKEGETRPVEVKGTGFFNTTGNIIKSKIPFVRNTMDDKEIKTFNVVNSSKTKERSATQEEFDVFTKEKEKLFKEKKDALKPDSKIMLNSLGHPTISYKEWSGKIKLYGLLTDDEKSNIIKSYKNQSTSEAKEKIKY